MRKLSYPVIICDECNIDQGAKIRYTSTGGWAPLWEGLVCEHLLTQPPIPILVKLHELSADSVRNMVERNLANTWKGAEMTAEQFLAYAAAQTDALLNGSAA